MFLYVLWVDIQFVHLIDIGYYTAYSLGSRIVHHQASGIETAFR